MDQLVAVLTVAGRLGARHDTGSRRQRLRVDVVTDLSDVFSDLESGRLAAAAIDIPIGLPAPAPGRVTSRRGR